MALVVCSYPSFAASAAAALVMHTYSGHTLSLHKIGPKTQWKIEGFYDLYIPRSRYVSSSG